MIPYIDDIIIGIFQSSPTRMASMSGREETSLRQDAVDLFEDKDGFMYRFYDASMVEVHKNISYYKENYDANMEILDAMLSECETYLSPQDLEYVLQENPNFFANFANPDDFDNLIFYLEDLVYEERNWIYKHEIVEMRKFLVERMVEYEKFLLELNVNFGVTLALIRSRECACA
jgi:hypothetical protein